MTLLNLSAAIEARFNDLAITLLPLALFGFLVGQKSKSEVIPAAMAELGLVSR